PGQRSIAGSVRASAARIGPDAVARGAAGSGPQFLPPWAVGLRAQDVGGDVDLGSGLAGRWDTRTRLSTRMGNEAALVSSRGPDLARGGGHRSRGFSAERSRLQREAATQRYRSTP